MIVGYGTCLDVGVLFKDLIQGVELQFKIMYYGFVVGNLGGADVVAAGDVAGCILDNDDAIVYDKLLVDADGVEPCDCLYGCTFEVNGVGENLGEVFGVNGRLARGGAC